MKPTQCPGCDGQIAQKPGRGRPLLKCFACVSFRLPPAPLAWKWAARIPEYARCQHCDRMFVRNHRQTLNCGDLCRQAAGRAAEIVRRAVAKAAAYPPRKCRECSAEFTPAGFNDRRVAFCSEVCRLTEKHRKGSGGHRKRAIRLGRDYEHIDRRKVFAADGWRCRMCGIETPESLIGSKDPAAPVLDHILPVARGGHHLRTNVQCACQRCNVRKGARLPSEVEHA